MKFQKVFNLLICSVFLAFLGACTSDIQSRATHYWQAETAKTERDYKIDHGACSREHRIDDAEAMPADSISFDAYRDCMVAKGYVLRTY